MPLQARWDAQSATTGGTYRHEGHKRPERDLPTFTGVQCGTAKGLLGFHSSGTYRGRGAGGGAGAPFEGVLGAHIEAHDSLLEAPRAVLAPQAPPPLRGRRGGGGGGAHPEAGLPTHLHPPGACADTVHSRWIPSTAGGYRPQVHSRRTPSGSLSRQTVRACDCDEERRPIVSRTPQDGARPWTWTVGIDTGICRP
eukprot:7622487-Pyramimonas_sp.AAC.1